MLNYIVRRRIMHVMYNGRHPGISRFALVGYASNEPDISLARVRLILNKLIRKGILIEYTTPTIIRVKPANLHKWYRRRLKGKTRKIY